VGTLSLACTRLERPARCEAEALLVAKLMKTTLEELLEREKKHQK